MLQPILKLSIATLSVSAEATVQYWCIMCMCMYYMQQAVLDSGHLIAVRRERLSYCQESSINNQ